MENIYLQFDGMIYQQILGIPVAKNCAPLIADLFLYCYERDFMLNLRKYISIYIKENFCWIKQILRTKKHISWI